MANNYILPFSGGGLIAYADSKSDNGFEPSLTANKKKVVVLGTGWAGTSFLKNVDSSMYDVQVISPRNYFAFTPLLPSVTCGTVEPRSIIEPIRNIIRKVCSFLNFIWTNLISFLTYKRIMKFIIIDDNEEL